MDARAETTPGQMQEALPSGRWRDLGLLALLLTLAVGVRAWILCHTEVAARDSIGFIRHALEFENASAKQRSWADVLRSNHQHPGYPLVLLAVSVPVRAFVDAPMPDLLRLSAQLASSLAGVLLILPMYYLGKQLFHRGAGFWSALLFQCLPVSGHILSDGLSEALFLLLTATGLLFGAQALHGKSRARFALCGVFCGLAYLTRPEGALLLAATGFSLVILQFAPAWRRTWRDFLACGASLTLAALATGSPYFLTTGCFSIKPSVHQIMGQEKAEDTGRHQDAGPSPLAQRGRPLFAVMVNTGGTTLTQLGRGLWGLGTEVINGFHYVGWLPAVIGIWWYKRRPSTTTPGMWPLLLLCFFQALVLWRLAAVVGYLSDRHIQVIVLCGIYPAAACLLDLPARLGDWLRAWGWGGRPRAAGWLLGRGGPVLSLVLLLALAGTGLPKTLQTLHGKRAGHHAAGLYLARKADPADLILDRHAWAHYYAGRVFTEGQTVRPAPGHVPACYHVINRSKDKEGAEFEPAAGELFLTEKQLKARGAEVVYHWPLNRPVERAVVIVYKLPGEADAEAEEPR
jgi:hypothetical protein